MHMSFIEDYTYLLKYIVYLSRDEQVFHVVAGSPVEVGVTMHVSSVSSISEVNMVSI